MSDQSTLQILQWPCDGALDQYSADEWATAGESFTRLENVRRRGGKFVKRAGFAAQAGGTVPDATAFGDLDGPVLKAESRLWPFQTFDPAPGTTGEFKPGPDFLFCNAEREPMVGAVQLPNIERSEQIAVVDGRLLIAWVEDFGTDPLQPAASKTRVCAQLFDLETKQAIGAIKYVTTQTLSHGTNIDRVDGNFRVVASAANFVFACTNNGGAEISIFDKDMGFQFISPVIASKAHIDIVDDGVGGCVAITCSFTGGINTHAYNSAGILAGPFAVNVVGFAINKPCKPGIARFGNRIFVAWNQPTSNTVAKIRGGYFALSTPGTFTQGDALPGNPDTFTITEVSCFSNDAQACYFFASRTEDVIWPAFSYKIPFAYKGAFTASPLVAPIASAAATVFGSAQLVEPFLWQGVIHVGITPIGEHPFSGTAVGAIDYQSVDSSLFICRLDAGTALKAKYGVLPLEATVAPRLVPVKSHKHLAARAVVLGNTVLAPVAVRRATNTVSIELVTLSVASKSSMTPAGQSLVLAGTPGAYYDKNTVNTQPPHRPERLYGNYGNYTGVGGPSIGLFPQGLSYVAVYAYTDNNGDVVRSAPSDPIKVINNDVQSHSVLLQYCGPVFKFGEENACIEFYRTVDGGQTFYRLPYNTNLNSLAKGASGQSTPFESGAEQSYVDAINDDDLRAQPLLYTQPGQLGTALPKASPPTFSQVIPHQDRLFGIADDGRTIWYTGGKIPGEGWWWSDAFQIFFNDKNRLTALASMDGSLYAFTKYTCYRIDGDGPADNGAGGGFTQPTRLPIDLGCVNQKSIQVTSYGLFYQSKRGIELLSRGGQFVWVGRPVVDTAVKTVAASYYLENEGIVGWFFETDSESIVFDTITQKWSLDKLAVTNGPTCGGVYTLGSNRYAAFCTRQSGQAANLLAQTGATFLDAGNFYTVTLESPWINAAGAFGEQLLDSLHIHGYKFSPIQVKVEWAYEHRAYKPGTTWASAQLDTAQLQSGRARLKHTVHNEARCTFARFKITDLIASPGNTGHGFDFVAIGLTLNTKPGANRLPKGAK